MKLAFIGLGVMGYHMAGHLQNAKHKVTVYNRTAAKADAWVSAHHGRAAPSPREAVKGAKIVFCCVGDDRDLCSVLLGPDGAFAGMEKDAVLVDNTTASALIARELAAEGEKQGIHFMDAPVSGGEAGAISGTLSVMCGGQGDVFARAKPVIDVFARAVTLMGPVGSGQLTKMANQTCIAGLLQGLSEAIHFSLKAGLDANLVLDVISKGAAQSWQMDNRGETMVNDEFEFGFAVDWMRKDLNIVLAEAERSGASMPVTALVDQFYKDVQSMGGGRWDTSSLIRRLTKNG